MEDVREWQNRPLDKFYVIVYLDALRVKSRENGKSCDKSEPWESILKVTKRAMDSRK